jgi:hypothetical protein
MSLLLSAVPWWGRALAIFALCTAMVGFGYVKGVEHGEVKLTAYKLANDKQHIADLNAAAAKTKQLQQTKDEAIHAATKRAQLNAVAAAAARSDVDSLRDQLAAATSRLSSATDAAVREYAATAGTLFSECTKALAELAGKADGHATDAATLEAAWPKP